MLFSLCPSRLSNAFAGVFAAAMLLLVSPARAMPCASPVECMSGFCVDKVCCDAKCDGACQACSAVAKGGGVDGTCGLAAVGSECKAAYCGGAALNYFGPSTCDAAGTCVEPAPVSCLLNEPCKFDLCSTKGCEQVTKLDGTACGIGKECNGGVCGSTMSTSSSSSSSSASTGAGGAGGAGGAMGAGGPGGAPSGGGYPPPSQPEGCGCHAAGSAPAGAAGAISAALLALLLIRSGRPRRRASLCPCEAARARSSPRRASAR